MPKETRRKYLGAVVTGDGEPLNLGAVNWTELQSSARTRNTLKHWVIALTTPNITILKIQYMNELRYAYKFS